jgi:hypothetical protein
MENPREKETWRLLVYTAEVSFSLGFVTLRGGDGMGRGWEGRWNGGGCWAGKMFQEMKKGVVR